MYNIDMKSKTIILSSPEHETTARGILTLYMEDDLLKCKLRLYSAPKLNRYCKLGVYHNNNVYSSNFIERAGVYESSLVGDFDMDGDFYTALILTDQNNKVLLAGGTYSGYFFEDTDVFANSDEFNTSNVEKNSCPYENNSNQLNEEKPDCAHCKYKEFFYSSNGNVNIKEKENDYNYPLNKSSKETDTSNNETNLTKLNDNLSIKEDNANQINEQTLATNIGQKTNIASNSASNKSEEKSTANLENKPDLIKEIAPQFDYVFNHYAPDDELNSRIENGKFVKLNEGKDNYSIGAIYDGDEMQYICYAVRRDYNEPAPEEIGKYYQWLPLDPDDPLSEGYFIVYQSAKDLKIVEI